ncbi:coiled-coil domain-containing protein 97 [Aphomia sociella]
MDNNSISESLDEEDNFDPIHDIIDYLVRCAKISFKNARIDQAEVRTCDKTRMAYDLYQRSPSDFLIQFGKHLAPYHIAYFETLKPDCEARRFQECVAQLKHYHSEESRRKRIRNRRYRAMQKLQDETDYFSEKQMMYRNPLLYEQLIGQYLTDEEIRERDGVDSENLTFLNMILETVDRNQMRETKNEQMLREDQEEESSITPTEASDSDKMLKSQKKWGDFDVPDTKPSFGPETRKQTMISAPERNLLREEFLQEMYSSFIDGTDAEIDYNTIDNDEQYDDLQQLSQDAEDRYFDSESNEVENLEEHMKLVELYGKKTIHENTSEDPLDTFMTHITNKLNV